MLVGRLETLIGHRLKRSAICPIVQSPGGREGYVSILLTGFVPFFPALDTYIIGNSSQKIVDCFNSGPSAPLPTAASNDLTLMRANVVAKTLPVKAGHSGDADVSAGALARSPSVLILTPTSLNRCFWRGRMARWLLRIGLAASWMPLRFVRRRGSGSLKIARTGS